MTGERHARTEAEPEASTVPAGSASSREGVAAPASAPRGLAAMQVGGADTQAAEPTAASSWPLQQREAATPDPDEPTWEQAMTTIKAICSIIGRFWEKQDGMLVRRTHPRDHPAVHEDHRYLLEYWFRITYGTSPSFQGLELDRRIDEAMRDTEPLVEIVRRSTDERGHAWIEENFRAPVAALRARSVSERVDRSIDTRAEALGAGVGFDTIEEKELRRASLKVLESSRLVATLVTRYTNGAATAEAAKLDAAFRQALKNRALPPGLEGVRGAANTQLGLMQLKGILDGVAAIVAVTDPVKREAFIRERPDLFGTVHSTVNIIQWGAQMVSGGMALIQAGTFALATVQGKAELAAQMIRTAAPALHKMNTLLNVIGVVHGTLVLLDDTATDAAKTAAGGEVVLSTAGLAGIGARLLGFAGLSGPFTLTAAWYYYSLTGVAGAYAGMVTGMIEFGLRNCMRDMAREGRHLHVAATRWAVALDLVGEEQDPAKKAEYLRRIPVMRSMLRKLHLKPYIDRATREKGNLSDDPGYYPFLRNLFAPLRELELNTDQQLLDATNAIMKTMNFVLTNPDWVLQRAIDDYVYRNGGVVPVRPSADPNAFQNQPVDAYDPRT